MSFPQEKRNVIKNYLLEKIFRRDLDFIEAACEAFEVSATSVYKYLKEMQEQGQVIRDKNGHYSLVNKVDEHFSFERTAKLQEDRIYAQTLGPIVKELPDNVVRIWQYGFMEMMNNAIEHSEAGKIDVYISQNALLTWVNIVDDGVGIFKKIAKHYEFEELEDAILALFKGKLTTDSKNHSGEGIFFTSRIMDHFFAISDGKVFTQSNTVESLVSLKENEEDSKSGTVIIMALANNSTQSISELFDRFASVEGGFTKTQIPMSKVCDSGYPVSRSQAKRLCFGLEKFQSVTLDFDKVEDIGQGFAHELFVVFKNNHPDIDFNYINTNDRVLRMIKHVLG